MNQLCSHVISAFNIILDLFKHAVIVAASESMQSSFKDFFAHFLPSNLLAIIISQTLNQLNGFRLDWLDSRLMGHFRCSRGSEACNF